MTVSISVDAMGGDFGPKITVPASLKFLKSHPDVHITLVGNESIIKNFLKKPIESLWVEKPPVAIVVIAWQTLSKIVIPNSQ